MNFPRLAIITGAVGGLTFAAGWELQVSFAPTLIVALIAGMSGVMAQTASRELATKSQSLIDRAIEQVSEDGGEGLAHARRVRRRLARLGLAAMILGVSAPTLAAIYTVIPHRFWIAAAWSFATMAVLVSILLFMANEELAVIIEDDKKKRAAAKPAQDAVEKRKQVEEGSFKDDPNFHGFGVRPGN